MEKTWALFTDGACSGNPGPGGWAYILISPAHKVYEGGAQQLGTTNNRMEMMSILEGLKHYKELALKTKDTNPLQVFTDSTYVIRGVTQWSFGWKKRGWKTAEGNEVANRDIWEELISEIVGLKIKWSYVRGHTGVVGNERCDEIAVAFSKNDSIHLHEGVSVEKYPFDILPLPESGPLPDMKSPNDAPKKPMHYLSYVNGVLERHADWKSCEMRVKGRPGAKFQKVHTEAEEKEILSKWGVRS